MNKIILVAILLSFFISGSFVTVFNSVSAAELIEDSWSTKSSMAHGQKWFEIVTFDDKIYTIGGEKDGLDVGFTQQYDTKTDKWTTLANMPTSRIHFGTVIYENKIYCIGGEVPYVGPVFVSQAIDVVEVYDPVTNTWSEKASVPTTMSRPMTCVINNQLFVITYDGQMYMYNSSKDRWSTKASIPVSTTNMNARVLNDQIFVICSSGAEWSMFMYNQATDSWIKKADPTVLYGLFDFIVAGNQIIMCDIPMYVNNAPLNFRIYDPETDKWREGQTVTKLMPNYCRFVGATSGVYAPENVYVFGGEQIDGYNGKAFAWFYDIVGDVWSTAKTLPIPTMISSVSLVVVDDIFYLIGEYGAVRQYVPIGYNPQGYPTPTSSSNINTSFVSSEPSGSFLTGPVVAIMGLTVGGVVAIISLVFLYKRKEKKKQTV